MDSKIRIIVADDHAVVREGIRIWLERDPRVEVVATADDTESLADRIDSFPCDVVISDIGMRGINGENNAIAFLRRFLRQPQRPRVIIVTMIAQPQMLAGLLDLGVDGLVDKRDCMDALNQAVIEVIDGGRFVSTHAGALLGNEMVNVTGRAGVLSAREWEVLQLYASGLSLISIAQRLARSVKTIGTQKRSAMRKLGLRSELELIDYLRQIGLA
ncbi:Transcriptional regulatory protein RcsB [Caballeronia sp. SBC1]|uniref:response regulator transcription factor n=1 Tax=unclassified Caballeronia TaxID=2646786 RepID=UPI0013E1F9B1|nr:MULTISPECIES: response regulator transcription factor [unclassified Caballeronia]QIE22344.1 Transcriptional regulatory protein RcsB [Caballeronia sp. SBC2]QIN60413.1 Transcriptional regulatory protein RcsB [Caballeronia sp. SBC1]